MPQLTQNEDAQRLDKLTFNTEKRLASQRTHEYIKDRCGAIGMKTESRRRLWHSGCLPNTTGTAAWQQEKLGMHGPLGALESGRQGRVGHNCTAGSKV